MKESIKQESTEKISGILRSNTVSRSRVQSISLSMQPSLQVAVTSLQSSIERSVTFVITEDEVKQRESCSNQAREEERNAIDVKNYTDMQRVSIAEEEANEDEYSASACEIMQRRSSSRRQSRRRRRPSSPFNAEAEAMLRRRSSVYTISSGETVISIEESGSQEQIFEKLKMHKEVLSGVKQQAWPLRRKIKLVRQAKSYVRRHEGVLQERLAHTRSTKDVIARISLFITKKWQYCRREMVNLQTWLVPWELRIKEIESHFGSAVASYFTFLRWLFWINLVMTVILTAFVAIPEMLTADQAAAGERKIMPEEEKIKSKHLLTLWEFEGILRYSPFFYGWYTNQDSGSGYRLPLAYFVTNLVIYIYSFVAILRKMAKNSRLSKLTEKDDECVFSWKLFTGWDFMIGNTETAHNRTASIVLGFKEALLEEAEKEKDERNWRIISMRIFVNTSVIALFGLSAYAVVKVVVRSSEELEQTNWWRQNEITVVLSLITYVFPSFFEILGLLESYHPRKQLRLQLARIMVLNLLNFYSLIFALFEKIHSMKQDLEYVQETIKNCKYISIECDDSMKKSQQVVTLASLSLILANNVTAMQYRSELPETTLPPFSFIPASLYLNPILDEKSLEEIYNVGDYPPLDYTYDNYDDITSNELNKSASISTKDITEETEFTTQMFEQNDIFEATTIFTIFENLTEISFTNFTEETDSSSMTSIFFNESTAYSETIEESDYNISTSTNTISSIITEDYNETFPTKTKEFITLSSMSSQINDTSEYSVITTLNTNTEHSMNTITFNRESSTENTNKISTIDRSSTTLREGVIPLSEKDYVTKCFEKICTTTTQNTTSSPNPLDVKARKKPRRLCWETMFGQELAKLTVMDLILSIVTTLSIDFFRAVFVRYMNNCWCWDLEKQFPQYGDFKIAENILHLVNNQGIIWMGMFFSPGLTALNLLKLGILMYLRSWAVLTCNVPHEVVFRASRSNNFYYALLLAMLCLYILPVGYAIVWVKPSWDCGPFSGYEKIYQLATKQLTKSLPDPINKCLDYITSPGIIIPLIVLMVLIIYYMVSLTNSLREANDDLKIQLRHERTEERRKLFKIVKKREELSDSSFLKWKRMLPALSKRSAKTRTAKVIDKPEVAGMVFDERKRSASEVVELTDMEQDTISHD
ncbi:transmembrane channel-like protein 3 isoform X1 [Bombus impatiens]|uniref:Transmembrane channel-like protein 3 isoform X1 n=1 Tax=Bombus impatiens TaxID=132113 RepID=A0A6P8L1B2_BOMIM|nr:transmembrane channel-like protein 3 isoform X1 [Bombus impatiens]XP_033175233.1 transmembrane channel-like protein 3 isoform X1 [Bombus impatiens]